MFTVAVTDPSWFERLRAGAVGTVNFWSPTPWNPNLARLEVGSPFCFMVKGRRRIGGYGLFDHYENLRAIEAWERWGTANGVSSLEELVTVTSSYARTRSVRSRAISDPEIGCFVLRDAVYFDDANLVEAEAAGIDFQRNIVKLKYFDGLPSFVSGLIAPDGRPTTQTGGLAYVRADESITSEAREPFAVDPDTVDRGLRAHRALQNELAYFAKSSGFEPERPASTTPNFDVGWWAGNTFVVVEVKSLSATNEVSQMRLGVGQILDYAHHYQTRGQAVRPVLAVEREPDSRWIDLCNRHGINVVWPGAFGRALIST